MPGGGQKAVRVVGPGKGGPSLVDEDAGREPARGLAVTPWVTLLGTVGAAWHREGVMSNVLCRCGQREAEKIPK